MFFSDGEIKQLSQTPSSLSDAYCMEAKINKMDQELELMKVKMVNHGVFTIPINKTEIQKLELPLKYLNLVS